MKLVPFKISFPRESSNNELFGSARKVDLVFFLVPTRVVQSVLDEQCRSVPIAVAFPRDFV
jgi:hypothetical protein